MKENDWLAGHPINSKLADDYIRRYRAENPEAPAYFMVGEDLINHLLESHGTKGLRIYYGQQEKSEKPLPERYCLLIVAVDIELNDIISWKHPVGMVNGYPEDLLDGGKNYFSAEYGFTMPLYAARECALQYQRSHEKLLKKPTWAQYFSKDVFNRLLTVPYSEGIRIYRGTDDAGNDHLIALAVDRDGRILQKGEERQLQNDGDFHTITAEAWNEPLAMDASLPCPDACSHFKLMVHL